MTSTEEAKVRSFEADGADVIHRAFIQTPAGRMHYRSTAGTGVPLVLVHSAMRSSRQFITMMRAMASTRPTIAIDLPSYGDSYCPDETITIDLMADAMATALDVLQIEHADLMGQAMGSYVAIEIAAREPSLVRQLIVANPPYYPTREDAADRHRKALVTYDVDDEGFPIPRTLEKVLELDAIHAPRNATRAWIHDENIDLLLAGPRFAEGLLATGRYAVLERAALVDCPVLMLWGQGFLYSERAAAYEAVLPNASRVDIPRSGLFPQYDALSETVAAINDFLPRS